MTDEQAVREPGWNRVMVWLEERMNFPANSQPLRLAALKMCGEHYLANKERDTALSRAEQAEAALAEERKAHQAFRKEVAAAWLEYLDAEPAGAAERRLDALILPTKPDPLVGVAEEAIVGCTQETAKNLREILAARGFEIIERAGGTIKFENSGGRYPAKDRDVLLHDGGRAPGSPHSIERGTISFEGEG